MTGVIFILAAIAVGQQVYIASRPTPDPVFNYPLQRVLSSVGGRPGVRLGADLTVRGTKCNTTGHPIPVSGTTSWVSVDPPGSVIETARGNAVRPPGCVTREFANPVPDAVASRTRALIADTGAPCVTWTVTGREVPTDPLILPAIWRTEPFDICP